ncbi:hypothetical protein evm_008232, partial [Chilo suppressalis]
MSTTGPNTLCDTDGLPCPRQGMCSDIPSEYGNNLQMGSGLPVSELRRARDVPGLRRPVSLTPLGASSRLGAGSCAAGRTEQGGGGATENESVLSMLFKTTAPLSGTPPNGPHTWLPQDPATLTVALRHVSAKKPCESTLLNAKPRVTNPWCLFGLLRAEPLAATVPILWLLRTSGEHLRESRLTDAINNRKPHSYKLPNQPSYFAGLQKCFTPLLRTSDCRKGGTRAMLVAVLSEPGSGQVLLCILCAVLIPLRRADNLELLLGTLRTHQKAACDEEMVTLICPRGTTISIQVAQYGASASQNSCASELAEYQPVAVEVVGDTSCAWPSTLQYSLLQTVVEACQKKRQCKFHTSPKAFGVDPCPGSRRFVEVAYKCRPYEFRSKVGCENDVLHLSCNPHSRVAIYSAQYGRTEYDSIQCPQPRGMKEE